MPYIFFFVGHFNDVDHLMPVAYKFCQSNRGRPIVLVTNPLYDIKGDYRFRFLKKKYGVPVVSVLQFHPANPLLKLVAKMLGLPLGGGFLHRWRMFALLAFRKLFYGKGWASRILDQYQPAALVFEWSNPTVGVRGDFIRSGHQRRIPAVSLPHGMFIYTNLLVNRGEQQQGEPPRREYNNLFDRLGFENHLHITRSIAAGIQSDKITNLGSARYSEEWQRVNLEIQPERFNPSKGFDCTYHVVFMLPQWSYNADLDATIQTLQRLSEEPWLHLVLKPHTREVETVPSYLRELNRLPNVEVAGSVGSVALIQWAEAVIVYGSGIALEALLQGKPLIDPRYLHDNTTIFEETGAEWTVYGQSELVDAVKWLSQGQPLPYGGEQISNIMSQLVLGSPPEQDVLGRYVDFILGDWRGQPAYEDSFVSPEEHPDATAISNGIPPAC